MILGRLVSRRYSMLRLGWLEPSCSQLCGCRHLGPRRELCELPVSRLACIASSRLAKLEALAQVLRSERLKNDALSSSRSGQSRGSAGRTRRESSTLPLKKVPNWQATRLDSTRESNELDKASKALVAQSSKLEPRVQGTALQRRRLKH